MAYAGLNGDTDPKSVFFSVCKFVTADHKADKMRLVKGRCGQGRGSG